MNKSLKIFSIVAATAFVACANESVLNQIQDKNDKAPIGFASFAEKATRGDVTDNNNLEYYHNTFAVYGTKKSIDDPTDIQYVFGGQATTADVKDGETCTYQTTPDALLLDWKYDDPRYWDKRATYDFIAYAPVSAKNPIRYYYSAANALVGATGNEFRTTSTYVLAGTNLQSTATESEKIKGFNVTTNGDLDLMVSSSNNQNGASHDNQVDLAFRHILSKLNVTFSKSEALQNAEVRVTDFKITGLKDQGDYLESNYNSAADPRVSGWTPSTSANAAAYKLSYTNATGLLLNNGSYTTTAPITFIKGTPFYVVESLVMPQNIADNQVTITATYTIKTATRTETFPYILDLYDVVNLRTLYDGYNYTLNFTIDPDIIRFDASTSVWATNAATDITIGQ